MSREIFNCDKQRVKDVESFISIGCNVVRVIKEIALTEDEILSFEDMHEKLKNQICTIKDSMIRFTRANGFRSIELNDKLNQKERENNQVLYKLEKKHQVLASLQLEYDEYLKYISYSTYCHHVLDEFYKYIKIQDRTRDEFLLILLVVIYADDFNERKKVIQELHYECSEKNEEEYKNLVFSLDTVEKVERYIKENY